MELKKIDKLIKENLELALFQNNGNITRSSKDIGRTIKGTYDLIKKFKIDRKNIIITFDSREIKKVDDILKDTLVESLKKTNWTILHTAKDLQAGVKTIYNRIEKFGIKYSDIYDEQIEKPLSDHNERVSFKANQTHSVSDEKIWSFITPTNEERLIHMDWCSNFPKGGLNGSKAKAIKQGH